MYIDIVKPIKNFGYTLKNINKSLSFFNSKLLNKNQLIGGPDQDDADAIISSAALRYFSSQKDIWNVPNVSKKEGWIFGVQINIIIKDKKFRNEEY